MSDMKTYFMKISNYLTYLKKVEKLMKKRLKYLCLFTLLCFTVIMTSCGKTEEDEKMQKENISAVTNQKNIDLQDKKEDNSVTLQDNEAAENINLPSGCIDAAGYIQSLSNVEAYSEGKYIVKGINSEKNGFCGVLYENGQLKVFGEYTRVYPLRDGRLLATTEEEPRDLSYEYSHIQFATVNGVIIDENGNIIFSSDSYLRFIPVSDNRLLVFNASSGFDGIAFEFGVLDSDGNWITELSQDNEIAQLFKDYVKLDSDGSWKFANSPNEDNYWDQSGVYYLQEWQLIIKAEDSVQIVINRQFDLVAVSGDNNEQEEPTTVFCTFTYDAKSDNLVKGNFNYTLYYDEPLQGYRLLSNKSVLFSYGDWRTSYFGSLNYDISTITGEIKEEIRGSYIGNDFYFDSENDVIRDILTGQTVELSSSICNHLCYIYEYENTFYAILLGDDDQYYIQRPGIDENPIRLEHYEKENVTDTVFFSDVFIYCNGNEQKVYIADSDSLEIIREIEFNFDGSYFNLYKLDESTFAIERDNYLIYNLNGKPIY